MLRQWLAGVIPGVRSLQAQRNHFAHLAEELAAKLAVTEVALQDAVAAATAVRSIQVQRDHFAHLANELTATLATTEAALQDALAAAAAAQSAEVGPAPTYHFKGYDIPVDLMALTGGGPETFDVISQGHIANLRKWIGLEPTHTLLEIGCGIGRDAIPLTEILTSGEYVGIDIIKRSIDWCSANISKRHPNFKFYHYDVEDQLHNGDGTTRTTDIYLPLPDQSVDRSILFSVFTHMFQADIEHYLRELRRVLKPTGLVYATTFIYDDAILEKARATNLTPFDLRFEHHVGEHCRINSPSHPLGAVAYNARAWDEMLAASGMALAAPMLEGAWSGFHADPKDGQDVAVLRPAPGALHERARSSEAGAPPRHDRSPSVRDGEGVRELRNGLALVASKAGSDA